jgi:hypothetical protein
MPLARFQVTMLSELRFRTPLSDGVQSSLKSVSGISTIPTVLLPNYKHRGDQVSCPTLRERRRPVRIGEVLAVIID